MVLVRRINAYFLKAQVMLGLFIASFFSLAVPVSAQENHSYSYDSINYAIQVNTDTTVDVVETQTYRFVGEYHQGWRNIPKKDFDDLTDVSVTDAEGRALTYSSKQLEKTNPSSWGKYATFYKDGEYVIEWYYDARDTTQTWILRYTLHGALAFYDDHDELYWNLFTAYTVPIGSVDAEVVLPRAVEDAGTLKESLYVEGVGGASGSRHTTTGFHFFANDLIPGATATIAPGWPKGLVDTGAYWRSWLLRNWGFIGAAAVAGVTILFLWFRWYFTERFRTGRGVVIPEYEPPKQLTPMMAEVLVYERLSPKSWSATVIDLAVRGYLTIEEIQENNKRGKSIRGVLVLLIIGIGIAMTVGVSGGSLSELIDFLVLGLLVIVLLLSFRGGKFLSTPSYILHRVQSSTTEIHNLEEYEKAFLDALFENGNRLSLKEVQQDTKAASSLGKKIQEISRSALQETAQDTRAYDVDFRAWKWAGPFMYIAPGLYLGLMFAMVEDSAVGGSTVFFSMLVLCLTMGYLFVRYNPRLNRAGQIFREEWLGFKLYLETAERYRLQNLTPATFEKFLPYAIIFGVEKEWGKTFEGITVSPPVWYSGSNFSSGKFSASGFSTSFSASFASAFASSGGSGASGGGGSAGGGGGGGGGGAS